MLFLEPLLLRLSDRVDIGSLLPFRFAAAVVRAAVVRTAVARTAVVRTVVVRTAVHTAVADMLVGEYIAAPVVLPDVAGMLLVPPTSSAAWSTHPYC